MQNVHILHKTNKSGSPNHDRSEKKQFMSTDNPKGIIYKDEPSLSTRKQDVFIGIPALCIPFIFLLILFQGHEFEPPFTSIQILVLFFVLVLIYIPIIIHFLLRYDLDKTNYELNW